MSTYIDSKTPRGPKRWQRAVDNYLKTKGKGKHAELFARRFTVAREYGASMRGGIPNVVVHEQRWTNLYARATGEWKTDYYTCSPFCTAMQLQLTFTDVDSIEKIHRWFDTENADGRVRISDATPSRKARCQCCGANIYSDGTIGRGKIQWPVLIETEELPLLGVVTPPPAVASPDLVMELTDDLEKRVTRTVLVERSGVIVEMEGLRKLELTDREFAIIESLPDDRANSVIATFAEKYGEEVTF